MERSDPIPPRLASALHLLTLAGAGILLVWLGRRQWFVLDEWVVIVDRAFFPRSGDLSMFEPHNDHPVFLAGLVYRALLAIVGLRTYVPYLAVVIVLHLVTVHLLYRLCRDRLDVRAPAALLVTGIAAVLGSGWENLLTAWQMTFVGSVAAGFGALLLASRDDPSVRSDAGVAFLAVLSVLASGVGVAMCAALALTVVLGARPDRSTGRRLALMLGPAVAVYGLWYLAFAISAEASDPPLAEGVRRIPEFVYEGMAAAMTSTLHLAWIGPLALALAVAGAVLTRALPGWSLAVGSAAGSVVFLALTGVRRYVNGVETAGSSRYVYVVMMLLAPLLALMIDRAVANARVQLALLVLGGTILARAQITTLADEATVWERIELRDRDLIVAAAVDADGLVPSVVSPTVAAFSPNLDIDEIVDLDRRGWLPDLPVNAAQVAAARLALQTAIGNPLGLAPGGQDAVTGEGDVTIVGDDRCPVVEVGEGGGRTRILGSPWLTRIRSEPGIPVVLVALDANGSPIENVQRPLPAPTGHWELTADFDPGVELRMTGAARLEFC